MQTIPGVDVTAGELVGLAVVSLVGPRCKPSSLDETPPVPGKKGYCHHHYILLRRDSPDRLALPVLGGSLAALGVRHFVNQGHAVGAEVSIDVDVAGVVDLGRYVLL